MLWLPPEQEEVLFGAFYVMTEGVVHDHGAAMMRKTYFFLMIDVGQVIRGLTNTRYGWTISSANAVRWVDVVWVIEKLLSSLIPRYYFFIFAALLVIVSLSDAFYVFQLFKDGQLGKLWPVKLLRALVLTIVTVSFSALLKWLLIPIECLGNDQSKGLVPYIHGEDEPCRPFAAPDIAVSLPTVLLALLYIVFALVNCVLLFEVNPLSRRPRSAYTGRVEVSWMMYKLSASILIYFSNIITPATPLAVRLAMTVWLWARGTVTVALIEVIQAANLMRLHLAVFPFNSFKLNALRGGIFGMICWLSLSNLVVASIEVNGTMDKDTSQVVQWALIAAMPVVFGLGIFAVHRARRAVHRSTERLRGEWERAQQIYALNQSKTSSSEHAEDPTKLPVKRTIYEKFYHSSWETWRAFQSAQEGLTTARLLLFRRREEDKPFLSYVLHRAMEEHPDDNAIFLFNRMMESFVFNGMGVVDEELKIAEAERGFTLDHRYIVYAIDRKKSQDNARKGVGKDTVSAINLMEFNSGMARAKKDHLECIQSRRRFWHDVRRMLRQSRKGQLQDDIVRRLIENLESMHVVEVAAKTEYLRLLANFKTSAQLNRTYADFADLCLNDENLKFRYLRAAAAIDGESVMEVDSDHGDWHSQEQDLRGAMPTPNAPPRTPGRPGSIASGSSENESARNKVARQIKNTLPHVLGRPMDLMFKLTLQTKMATMFILMLATLGYCLLELVLFRNQADTYLHLIDQGGHFETAVMTSTYLLRSQLLAGMFNDSHRVEELREELDELVLEVQHTMWKDYEAKDSKAVKEYFQEEFEVYLPLREEWVPETQTFWTFGNDFARRIMMAAASNVTHWADYAAGNGEYIREQGNVDYVYVNVAAMIPAFEGLVEKYVDLMRSFGSQVLIVVSVMAGFNGITILLVFGLFIRSLHIIVKTIQFQMVVLDLVMDLSVGAVKTLQHTYTEAEDRYRMVEDGFENEQALPGDMPSSPGRRSSLEQKAADSESGHDRLRAKPLGDPLGNGGERSILRQPFRSDSQDATELLPNNTSELTEEAVHQHILSHASGAEGFPRQENGGSDGSFGGSGPMEQGQGGMGNSWSVLNSPPPAGVEVAGQRFGATGGVKSPGLQGSPEAEREGSDTGAGVGITGSRFGQDAELGDLQVWEERGGQGRPVAPPPPRLLPAAAEAVLRDSLLYEGEGPAEEAAAPAGGRGVQRSGEEGSGGLRKEAGGGGKAVTLDASQFRADSVTVSAMLVHPSPSPALPRAEEQNGGSRAQRPLRSISFHEATAEEEDEGRGLSADAARRRTESFRVLCGEEAVALVRKHVEEVLYRKRPWYLQKRTFLFAFIVLPALAIFSLEYPARGAKGLVQFAPAVHLATHRQYLAKKCAWLVRELVLADRMSRMRVEEIAYEIDKAVERMDRVDKAIRLGGDLGNDKGADTYSDKHNEVMYEIGCQWREDQEACHVDAYPGVIFKGLYSYIQAYKTAVRAVVARYGPPRSEWVAPSGGMPELADAFAGVRDDLLQRLALFDSDPDLRFIVDNADLSGDLHSGFEIVGEDFFIDAREVLSMVRQEARAFFGVYVASLMLFYVILFRRVQEFASESALRARNFVSKIPAYMLTPADVDTIVYHFNHDLDKDDQDPTQI